MKGYGRMHCYNRLCAICTENGYQNWQELQALLDEMCESALLHHVSVDHHSWKRRISQLRTFLRCDLRQLCTLDNECADLCLRFALSDPNPNSPSHSPCKHDHTKHHPQCDECQLLYEDARLFLESLSHIQGISQEKHKDWHERLEVCEFKTSKYVGHLMRDANAQQHQDETLRVLPAHVVQVIADYMMKRKGYKFAEIQTECFAKSSFSMLGTLSLRRLSDNERDAKVAELGSIADGAEFECRFVNLISDDAQQDWFKFAVDFFAVVSDLKKKHPDLQGLHLYINGAGNLTSIGVLYALMHCEDVTGVPVLSCNCCEPGKGKMSVDTNFAHCKGHGR